MAKTLLALLGGMLAFPAPGGQPPPAEAGPTAAAPARPGRPGADAYRSERDGMIREQLVSRGIRDALVLGAMRSVPRHLFVPERLVDDAYLDGPLPIGHDQTISQPYIVAFMTEALELKGGEKVLEVGTGSGYQAAVLAEIVASVYSVEILEPLAREAETRLARLHYDNVHVRVGDGYRGWPEEAPFDAIIVTAAPEHIPQPLIDQLKMGGRLVIPVGNLSQELVLVRRTGKGVEEKSILPVRFVPMTGEARRH